VDYAYQARKRFPDRRVVLTGEIIHNPHVNERLRAQGIRFLTDAGESIDALTPDDVVLLPAFGVTIELLEAFERRGCTLVDTTCGSVLNVWKNVKRYAADGFTSVIHGKYWHEETRATASQASHGGEGHYLVVLNREEAAVACRYICGGAAADPPRAESRERGAFLSRFEHAISPGFDPDLHLPAHRVREPDDDAQLGIARHRRDVPRRDAGAVRRGRRGHAVPCVRHHLQRDPGSPGCRGGGSSTRKPMDLMVVIRRLQQQQHVQPSRG